MSNLNEILPISALAVFIIKEIYSIFKDNSKQFEKSILELNYSIQELKIRFDHLNEILDEMPKVRARLEIQEQHINEIRSHISKFSV